MANNLTRPEVKCHIFSCRELFLNNEQILAKYSDEVA